ncbi:MAG: hypothetical protein ABL883_13510 [Terricaulis sp.]
MRFRLIYEGELKPSQLDPLTGNPDKLAEHKHHIRRVFHHQLRQHWATNKFLRDRKVNRDSELFPSPGEDMVDLGEWTAPERYIPLVEAVGLGYREYGYTFVPLVLERFSLRCALKVLLLKRDFPGSGVINAGDLDNRIKTLIDGLRRPRNGNELRGPDANPRSDEVPFFCLLEDDTLVTELSVETDTLLKQTTTEASDQRLVHAVITVQLQPYDVTTFNLAFA